jgi:hypothetical protein
MKIILAALFVLFTRADGQPVHIAPGMVTEITTPFAGACPPGAKTFVRTLSSTYCVRDLIEDVRAKLEDASREDKLLSPERDRPR